MSDSEVTFNCYKILHIWTMVVIFSPSLSGYTWSKDAKTDQIDHHLAPVPTFEDITITEMDANVGQTLLLPCTVRNLGDKVVSWIRTRDLHILTSGEHTFSADSRFESVYSSNRDFWGLRIRGVRVTDTGQYECQVNTDPKMSLAVNLTVTVPGAQDLLAPQSRYLYKATIKGPKEVYVNEGAPVTFSCEISPITSVSSVKVGAHGYFQPVKPRVRWLHEEKELSFESNRGGIAVDTDYMDRKVNSELRVSMVTSSDGGVYTCSQAATQPDSVKLVVVEAEHSEMQRDFPVNYTSPAYKNYFSIFLYIISYVINNCF